ncbi:MAG: hypothetical protein AAFR23_02195 [Pseudomonadota bacterium]
MVQRTRFQWVKSNRRGALSARSRSRARWRASAVCICLVSALAGSLYVGTQTRLASAEPPTAEAYAAHVGGKIIKPGQLVIDNNRLYCGKRPTVLDSTLDDYGAAFPGFLILNPDLLSRVSTPVKLWIFSHECAHQFRGPDEALADCFAVQRGRRQGWLTQQGMEQICNFIRPAKGSIMHPAGPERCKLMRKCFAEKRVR